jgi:hypothetical protein
VSEEQQYNMLALKQGNERNFEAAFGGVALYFTFARK